MTLTEKWSGGNRHGETWTGPMNLDTSVPRYGDAKDANEGPLGVDAGLLHRQVFTAPAAASTNAYVTSLTGRSSAGTGTLTLDGALVAGGVGTPDFPRNASLEVTHASSIVAETFVVTGTDSNGNVISETLTMPATGTDTTVAGKMAFATITSITETSAADASGNTIVIGTGVVFGLGRILSSTGYVLIELEDGSAASTAGTFVVGVTSATANEDHIGTYSPNTAPNGTHDYEVIFYVTDPDSAYVA